ncbi:MAG: AtpZ/AtpI family protein [Balneolaceae bacterium]|nr:AtpZ/AtpI family protein [Balneolaceae bacterium]
MNYNLLPKKYLEYIGLGSEIALSIALPILLGRYIDTKFDSSPVGILVGVGFGLLLFFLVILRISKKLNNRK